MSPQVLPPAADGAAGQPQAQGGQQQQEQQRVGPSSPHPGASVLELLDGFLAVQQERAAAYRRFDAAFRAYLQNHAEGPFRWAPAAAAVAAAACCCAVLGLNDAVLGAVQEPSAQAPCCAA